MKPFIPALAVAAMLGATSPTFAQQTPAPAQPAASAPATSNYSETDARAVLNARLAALKTVIELTPDQEKLWPALETAIRDISKNAAQRRQNREKADPKDFLDILEVVADDEAARAADLKRFVAAAKPFVASLTPVQKRRIPAFLGMMEKPGVGQPSSELWIFEEEE
ncbi:Spy/CpxP family protein refolding chaperone [Aquabacter sp. CN5-332]|uniref:Spy/CpxP family protein refolding chaperone n=1 Tax=Aquabacter sp. CN5-332 TaxID=3156608 RepID=UPI0032B49462